jgi:hypothetical protein
MSTPSRITVGDVIGKLTIIKYLGLDKHRSRLWECLCKCGKIVNRTSYNITKRKIPSCGVSEACKNHYQGDLKEATATVVLHNYKQGCKKTGRSFNLSKQDFLDLIFNNCHYCRSPPFSRFYKKKGTYVAYNGLDRVENTEGYRRDNVVPCCFICNRAKGSFTQEQWNAWLERISSFQRTKKHD